MHTVVRTIESARPSASWKRAAMALAGVALLAAGLLTVYRTALVTGVDFPQFYGVAHRYVHGQNPYVLSGDPARVADAAAGRTPPITLSWYLYPPLASAMLAPLALFNYPTARAIWLVVTFGALFAGLWAAMALMLRRWSPSARLLLLGALACSSAVRWNAFQLQITTLMVGLLGLFLYGELRGRPRLALAAGVLASVKVTLFLPVVGLLLFRRKYREMVVLGVVIAALNALAVLPTGVPQTVAGIRVEMANAMARGTNNYPDPHIPLRAEKGLPLDAIQTQPGTRFPFAAHWAGGEQLHWVYLLASWTPSLRLAQRLAALASLLAVALLAALWRQSTVRASDARFALRMFALLCAFSLVCAYHQRYDALLLLYPGILALAGLRRRTPWREMWPDAVTLAAAAFFAGLFAERMYHAWMHAVVVPGDRVWLMPVGAYCATIVFAAQLIAAWREARAAGPAEAPATAVVGGEPRAASVT